MKGSLDIELTRRCNLRCDYCFVGWSRGWQDDMPEAIALRVVEEGAGLFPLLHLTGGEPFAYRGIFRVIEASLERGYEEILINTNGTMITEDVVLRLASYGPRVGLSVSLDGPPAIHDRARGEGSFQQASEGLGRLLSRGVRASVMSVITPEVLDALVPFLSGLRRDHPAIAGFTLFPVGVGPEGSQKPGASLRPLTPDELKKLAFAVALLYRLGYPIGIGAYPIVNPLLLSFGYPASLLYQCTAGRGRAAVHADLTVSTCHPVKEAVYGSWRPGLLAELSAFPAHARLARRDFDGCSSCSHVEECGHCRAFVAASGEPFFGNDEICRDIIPDRGRAEAAPPSPPPPARRRVALPIVPSGR